MTKIKEYREKAGLTQVELANKLGVKQPTVAGWEMGIRYPRPKYWGLLAKVLKCKIDALYGREQKNGN